MHLIAGLLQPPVQQKVGAREAGVLVFDGKDRLIHNREADHTRHGLASTGHGDVQHGSVAWLVDFGISSNADLGGRRVDKHQAMVASDCTVGVHQVRVEFHGTQQAAAHRDFRRRQAIHHGEGHKGEALVAFDHVQIDRVGGAGDKDVDAQRIAHSVLGTVRAQQDLAAGALGTPQEQRYGGRDASGVFHLCLQRQASPARCRDCDHGKAVGIGDCFIALPMLTGEGQAGARRRAAVGIGDVQIDDILQFGA